MKILILLMLIQTLLLNAQIITNEIYPTGYTQSEEEKQIMDTWPKLTLPDHYAGTIKDLPYKLDNSQLKYFRPVFSQKRFGSCAQASGIGYVFTYHMNFLNDTDASLEENQFPTHYTYNFLNEGNYEKGSSFQGGWNIVKSGGIPNFTTYGGMWPTEIAEPYEETEEYLTKNSRLWMDGFEKYKSGMNRRIIQELTIPVGTPEGLLTLKLYMNDYLDGSANGGIVCFSASVYGNWENDHLPVETENAGDRVILKWATGPTPVSDPVGHAMTFVGYNDSIRFDFNGDGKYAHYSDDGQPNHDEYGNPLPMSEWEVGGLLMVNSWGTSWGTNGKAWVPYRTLAQNTTGSICGPGVSTIKVTDSYEPLLYLKADITSSKRNKLKIMAGISNYTDATEPEYTIEFTHFNFRGGEYGMAGDGDTIELGLDISRLLDYPSDENTKIFLSIEHDDEENIDGSAGSINSFAVIDNQNNISSNNDTHTIVPNTTTHVSVKLPGIYPPETYYVNPDPVIGDDQNEGDSPMTPFKTISKALDMHGSANTIILAEGIYDLSSPDEYLVVRSGTNSGLNITKSVKIIGTDPETTIIQAHELYDNAETRIFYSSNNENPNIFELELKNLTLKNGKTEGGGAIKANGLKNLTIDNCRIIDNISTSAAGAIHWNSNELKISNSYILNNYGTRGGGIYCESGKTEIFSSTITGNSAFEGGGIYASTDDDFIIDKCIISENEALENASHTEGGGGLYFQNLTGSPGIISISNSSIINNSTATVGGGVALKYSEINFSNSTISGNYCGDGIGDALFLESQGQNISINSCTIVENGIKTPETQRSAVKIYSHTDNPRLKFEINNSIISGNYGDNYSRKYWPPQYSRSYTISDDNTLPNPGDAPDNLDDTDPMITSIRNEEGTHFYKLLAGSPAKDAIPELALDVYGNPFNGAPLHDQRGFNVWNQRKDIGAYESPYYWVDVPNSKDYQTIPSWKTELKVADWEEYDEASPEDKWKWTDYMRAQSGGRIILSDNSEIIVESGSELHWYDGSCMDVAGNSKITDGSNFIGNANVNILNGAQLSLLNPSTSIPASASFSIGSGSKLVLEGESTLYLENGLNVSAMDNAELLVYGPAKLNAEGASFNYTGTAGGTWKGINFMPGSKIDLDNVTITDASTAVSGSPALCSITNSNFTNCDNGVILDACSDVRIIRNSFTGNGTGAAITVTQSDGWINNNTVSNFYRGINAISCSPLMVQNTVTGNILNGIYVAGYNTYPQMVNPLKEANLKATGEDIGIDDRELNNTVYNNGVNYVPPTGFINKASQIYMVSNSNIYLDEGMNNIYSDNNSVPCIRTISLLSEGVIPTPILIYAPENYWGAGVSDSFFALSDPYHIDYSNPATVPYGSDPFTSTGPQEETKPSKLLSKAIQAELDGKYDKAIKTYEKIIDKYPDSREADVAYTKLPNNYVEEDLELEPLIVMYDNNLNASEGTVGKKFFKEMKVATFIKGKKYDDAISISEEMLAEAETEEEEILCLIDIAIANMLKNSSSKNRNNNDAREKLSGLYAMLQGGEKDKPAGITENAVPSSTMLYQNYPNPFNPVTQIKFALAKTADVKLSVYNISGQKVADLANGSKQAGIHTVDFDGSRLNSGIYYYTLEIDGKNITKKMVLTK